MLLYLRWTSILGAHDPTGLVECSQTLFSSRSSATVSHQASLLPDPWLWLLRTHCDHYDESVRSHLSFVANSSVRWNAARMAWLAQSSRNGGRNSMRWLVSDIECALHGIRKWSLTWTSPKKSRSCEEETCKEGYVCEVLQVAGMISCAYVCTTSRLDEAQLLPALIPSPQLLELRDLLRSLPRCIYVWEKNAREHVHARVLTSP